MRVLGWVFAVLVLAGLAVGGYILKRRYDAFMADTAQCVTDRDKLKAEAESLAKEGEEKGKEAQDAKGKLKATKAELKELRGLRDEAEKRLQAFNAVTEKLQKMIDTGKLKVIIRRGRMVVKLPAEVLFASGKADLSPEGQATLAEVAKVLKEFRDRKFMVAGHTDILAVGPGEYKNNWELSTARALTVTEFLISKGMPPPNLAIAGYGEWDPVATNKTPQGQQENRRIELVLLPHSDELMPIAGQEPPPAPSAAPKN